MTNLCVLGIGETVLARTGRHTSVLAPENLKAAVVKNDRLVHSANRITLKGGYRRK